MKKINTFAVTGYPVAHSKSPLIFNTLFSSMDIPAYYSRLSAKSGEEASDMFRQLGLAGMNITSPLKNEMLLLSEERDEPSDIIGGVNTLVNVNGTLKGYNTDHSGISETFIDEEIDVSGKKCLVLGAGSAGRAAVYALTQLGGQVTIMNRTFKKAHVLAGDMDCEVVVFEKLQSEIFECDLLISTITSGSELIKKGWLKKDTIVFDALYRSSTLAETASSAGCRVLRGEKWLLNQAIPAFKIFTGEDVNKKEKDKLSGILDKSDPDISELVLMGKRGSNGDIKNKLEESFKNEQIKIITDPDEIETKGEKHKLKKIPLRILIYSGSIKEERELFPFSDLVIWGKGGIDDTAERIIREIEYVL